MTKQKKITLIVIGALLLIFTVLLASFYALDNKSENNNLIVTGEILHCTDFSITVSDTENMLYIINVENPDYKIGDYVSVYSIEAVLESYPMQVKASTIKITSKPIIEEETIAIVTASKDLIAGTKINEEMLNFKYIKRSELDNLNNVYTDLNEIVGKYVIKGTKINNGSYINKNLLTTINSNDASSSNNSSSSNDSTESNDLINNKQKTEQDVVNYFTTLNNSFDHNPAKNEFSIKKGFVTIVDFLFYKGEIYGKTFNDLTDATKTQILKIALYIDNKIDNVFPEYKETISNATGRIYNNVKNKVITIYLDTTTKICKNNQNICNQAKSDFQDMKDSFSITWDFLKDIGGNAISKLSDWYLIWRTK